MKPLVVKMLSGLGFATFIAALAAAAHAQSGPPLIQELGMNCTHYFVGDDAAVATSTEMRYGGQRLTLRGKVSCTNSDQWGAQIRDGEFHYQMLFADAAPEIKPRLNTWLDMCYKFALIAYNNPAKYALEMSVIDARVDWRGLRSGGIVLTSLPDARNLICELKRNNSGLE